MNIMKRFFEEDKESQYIIHDGLVSNIDIVVNKGDAEDELLKLVFGEEENLDQDLFIFNNIELKRLVTLKNKYSKEKNKTEYTKLCNFISNIQINIKESIDYSDLQLIGINPTADNNELNYMILCGIVENANDNIKVLNQLAIYLTNKVKTKA